MPGKNHFLLCRSETCKSHPTNMSLGSPVRHFLFSYHKHKLIVLPIYSDEEGEMVAAMALLNEKPIGSLWKQSSNPRKKRNRAKTAQAVPRRRKSCDTHTIMPKFLSLSPRGHISKVHSSEQPRARRVPSTSQGGISPLSQKKLRLKRKILNRKKLLEQLPGICSLSAAYSESHLLIGIP
eukprot:TRINITY_DN1312_c0_g1_i1.p1 TRINITY_DN1312_c0_g1~~TRINITY_DN1312_c0_g1_i1.p1  ORF type:complete len:180 (-),score=3.22 TRINITY_DN1312_c0_g1_i1:217-756(-)